MLRTGLVIGGIRIDALLGQGAMGEVYRGLQLALKRPVAVKRIASHLLGDQLAVARFAHEAHCVARVQSPNLVGIYDFSNYRDDQGEEHCLLVMELVEGGTNLGVVLAKRAAGLPWREATSCIMQVAEGLAAAAEFNVLHRDIKPDNIMITRKGVAKLADFGLAKTMDSSSVTQAGGVIGTPLYISPEACRGQGVDARSDLYALGCTWFHLIAGDPPFTLPNTLEVLRAHVEDAPPEIRHLVPEVPEAIAALVMRLLAKRPEERLPSAQALVDALHALAGQGLVIPRTVPEIFTGGPGPGCALPEQDIPGPALQRPQVGPAPAVRPGARAAPMSAGDHGRWLMVGMSVILVLGVTVAALRSDAVPRIEPPSTLAIHNFPLALQRAEFQLASHPEDAQAVAGFRQVVQAEAQALSAAGRHQDALRRLTEHRAAHTWLDTSVWEREVSIAKAGWLAAHHQEDAAVALFHTLRQEAPEDPAICRAMVDTFADGAQRREAVDAAQFLARSGGDPLDAKLLSVLTDALAEDDPFAAHAQELRALLAKRAPELAARLRPWLSDDGYEKRFNAYLLLKQADALSEGEELAFHLVTLLTCRSSYAVSTDALAWLTAFAAQPDWESRKGNARLAPITTALPLMELDEHADRVVELLAKAFRPEVQKAALVWIGDADRELRWNGYRVLAGAHQLDRIDEAAFHAHTLVTFDAIFSTPDFVAALAFCSAQSGGPGAAAAQAALTAAVVHIKRTIAGYERLDDRYMQMRAHACREQLAQVKAVLGKIER